MKCPVCAADDTRVIDSRSIKEGAEIRRRRLCDACSHRFTTYERAEGVFPMVVKKDDRREPWSRDKVLGGIAKACEKRPVAVVDIERLTEEVSRAVTATGEAEVPSQRIGELIMDGLKRLDEVAYVRFASVYRSFKDIDEFMSELSALAGSRDPAADEPPQKDENDAP